VHGRERDDRGNLSRILAQSSGSTSLRRGWLIVDGFPLFHRSCESAGADAPAMVHVHGFGISGTYLEPTAERLTHRFRTFVPDLPGMGRSMRRDRALDLP
jgi:pimeloyl-ACP methyl ester carboxylesterase